LIFKTEKAKLKAVAEEIKKHHKAGRPVLVGSASIEKNEQIAKYLDKEGIKYNLLNAKNNEHEASIVARAGEKGAITLATNIAGRGTDIKLGKGVKELGGLVVLGSERHESRRIDNQLRGRGGRQGDPGETQFYVSTEDDLMRIFQGERIARLMEILGVPEDQPIQDKRVSKTLESAQKRVEGFNFDTRKNVVQYDNVINRHRKVVYAMRRKILEGEDIAPQIKELMNSKVIELVELPSKNNPDFVSNFVEFFPAETETIEAIGEIKNDKKRLSLAKQIVEDIYNEQKSELGEENLHKVEREVYMQILDTLWMNHLENMQHLREGIHWRSVGQRDPLVEYREESQKLFNGLQNTLRDETIRIITRVKPTDVMARQEEDHETELTKLAENAVEAGVNEIQSGEKNRDGDFKTEKATTAAEKNAKKNAARKAKKAKRQNKKKGRK
jgi:preprotein translocase subunit SecA